MTPVDSLRRYPLFALLGDRGLAAWVAEAHELAVEPGQTLTRSGQPGEYAYLVLAGRVRVLSHGPAGREVALGAFGPGEVFGEYALLPPHLDTATCRAGEPGRVLRLPLAQVRDTLAGGAGVGYLLKNWLRLHALAVCLRGGAFLGFLSAPSVLPLLDRCTEEGYPAGHTVQAHGLCDDSWFFVRSGELLAHPPQPGRAARLLGPGDCFGERALYGRGRLPRVEVRQDATLVRLSREEFIRPLTGEQLSVAQTHNPARVAAPGTFEWVPQRSASDCGAAALVMAARRVGAIVTQEQLAALLGTDGRGVSLEALAQAAAQVGLTATAARVASHLLDRVRPPAVLHFADGHYTALLASAAGQVVIGDPARGVLTWPTERLAGVSSGAVLLIAPPSQRPSGRASTTS